MKLFLLGNALLRLLCFFRPLLGGLLGFLRGLLGLLRGLLLGLLRGLFLLGCGLLLRLLGRLLQCLTKLVRSLNSQELARLDKVLELSGKDFLEIGRELVVRSEILGDGRDG